MVFANPQVQRRPTGFIHGGRTVFLGERKHSQDAPDRQLSLPVVHAAAERTDVSSRLLGALELVMHSERSTGWEVLVFNTVSPALLPNVFAKQSTSRRI